MGRTNRFFLVCLWLLFSMIFMAHAGRKIIVKIAFPNSPMADIIIMDEDGKNQHFLTNHSWKMGGCRITTDGEELVAFMAMDKNGFWHAYALNILTHEVKELIPNPPNNNQEAYDVSWSPNRKKIAFTSGTCGPNPELYVADADGLSPVLVDKGGWLRRPTWIDNNTIGYGKEKDVQAPAKGKWYILDLKEGKPQEMNIPLPVIDVAWTSLGDRTAIITADKLIFEKTHLYLGDAEGKNLKHIKEKVFSVDWSKDGQYLVYIAGGDRLTIGGNVFIMEISTGKTKQLTDDNMSFLAIWFEPSMPVPEKNSLITIWGKIKDRIP